MNHYDESEVMLFLYSAYRLKRGNRSSCRILQLAAMAAQRIAG